MADKREEFKAELNALLIKYECDITASDEWMGYAECGQDIQICIEFDWSQEESDSTGSGVIEDLKFGTGFYRQPL